MMLSETLRGANYEGQISLVPHAQQEKNYASSAFRPKYEK